MILIISYNEIIYIHYVQFSVQQNLRKLTVRNSFKATSRNQVKIKYPVINFATFRLQLC